MSNGEEIRSQLSGGGSGRGGYGVADVVLEPPRKRPARVLMINDTMGVLVGDHRYEGWLVHRHPDGPWVTMRKLEAVDLNLEVL